MLSNSPRAARTTLPAAAHKALQKPALNRYLRAVRPAFHEPVRRLFSKYPGGKSLSVKANPDWSQFTRFENQVRQGERFVSAGRN